MGTNIGPNTRVVAVGFDDGTVIERSLEERDAAADAVRTFDACLERLSRADGVVIGDSLPETDLVDCCGAIRDRRSDVPIVVFPADGSEALAGAVVAAGADGYVPRSQGVETLLERLGAVLADRSIDDRSADAPAATATDAPSPASADDPSDRLELLVEQSPLAIIEWNLDFEVRSWNPAATELFGYTADEAVGESATELLVSDDDYRAAQEYRNGLVSGDLDDEPSRHVYPTRRKDGSTVTCEWFNTPLVEDGEVVGVLSFGQDVTADVKRATALEALQETTQELLRAESTDEIADIVMAATEDVIDDPLAGIRFYDEEREALELAGSTATLDDTADLRSSIGSGDSVFWEAYANQEQTIVENVPSERIPYDITAEIGTTTFQPLGDHGLLTVASSGDDDLDAAEINLVRVLAATAEAALDRAARECELERTRTVVETVGDCVYQLDRDGRFVTVNNTMGATGYDRDDLVGEHVSTILTEESVERGKRHIRSLVADDERRVATCEVTLQGPDGERTPAEVNMALLDDDDGDPAGTVGIARDISDRKRMERKLVDRKAKIEGLHSVASRLDDCESRADIYDVTVEAAEEVLNFDGCLVDRASEEGFVTEAASAGLETDRETRRPIDEGIAGQTYFTQEPVRIDDVVANDAPTKIDDCRSVLSVPIGERGVFQAVSTDSEAFTRADEELAELLLSHVADALDRIAFRKRLRAERDRFAALFENVPDGVVSVTQLADDPIVEAINPAFERLFGYEEAELVGERIDRIIVPSDRRDDAETLNQQGSHGEIGTAEVKRQTADGLRDFRLRVVPMEMDGSSDRAFALYTDITEQKQRQKRLEILNRVLRHDLRNGMNIISGCAGMVADAVDGADGEYVEIIQGRASELIGLAEKTRAVERVLDRDEVPAGPIDLSAAVEQSVTRLEDAHPDVDVTCSLPDRAFARADEYLQTAIFQVLENAVEHNDRDSPTIDVTLWDRPDDELLALSVADDGPGMPADERELLEGDREITQLRHASGLGLWLVNWVVTQTGGRLSFDDNEPRGTVVTLEVPRADAESISSTSDGTAAGD